ncbi:Fc.00g047390.m01.CDS01 [Cosmosporella sp. VM-42]
MSLQRSSINILRRAAVTAPLRRVQIRHASAQPGHLKNDGDLGGPGGQQPPPPSPGGPEALKRNWYFSNRKIPDANAANWNVRLPIGAAAGLVLVSVWYMSSSPGAAPARERTRSSDMLAASSTEIGAMSPPTGKSIAKYLEDKESAALGELSGRKGKDGMGGFRAD